MIFQVSRYLSNAIRSGGVATQKRLPSLRIPVMRELLDVVHQAEALNGEATPSSGC
jgi:hypothetical protein